MTTGLVAMWCFRGNFEAARALLSTPRYVPPMLSRSRLNRRLHRLTDLFLMLFDLLGCTWKPLNTESIYVIDSFPVAVCDHDRIPRAELYQNKQYRGCLASKQRYFYGLNVHLLVTKDGQPVEGFLTPGSYSDVRMLQDFRFAVPEGSHVYADKAYNDYAMEDILLEASQIRLSPLRQKHSKRPLPPYLASVQHDYRKRIETVGSLIERMLPKSIHAVPAEGFELTVFLFVLAYSLNCL
ncbi:MAG: IS982 family transposase [Candidatus Tectomicrobia bacterium]|nr:IS982 family transposase [Candidatus Tectomicrobia bacterium]